MKLLIPLFAGLLALTSGLAAAQTVSDCDWRARADAVVEPWEENTRTFANGAVRLSLLDTIEPAAVPFHILVLSPPYGELGERQCRIISLDQGTGFGGVSFSDLTASYDPAIGLRFEVPVVIYLPEDGFSNPSVLIFTVNQATGQITTDLLLGNE